MTNSTQPRTQRPTTAQRATTAQLTAASSSLTDLLGSDRVSTGDDILAQHGHDESFHPEAKPDLVVWPHSTAEAQQIVRVALAHHVPLIPFGAGSSLEGHVSALYGGISVDMREMSKIAPPSATDLDVQIEAGVTRRQLDTRLQQDGLFFSVDPGADATLGGMAATGASGTTTVRYGTMRENVLGLTIVNGFGEIVRTHSRARKSSAGYDLTRVIIGSEGTLGLICELNLRIHPIPPAIAAATCTFPTVADAVACVVQVAQYSIPVARMELADELQVKAFNHHFGTDLEITPTLFLEFHGSTEDDVAAQAKETAEIASEHGGSGFEWASDESERRRLWHARHGALDATRSLHPGSAALTTDVCVPVSALADCIAAAQADVAAHDLICSIVGHVGDGNFHALVLVDPDDQASIARGEEFHARLVANAQAQGGTCTGEHGVGYGKARFLTAEHGESGVAMMRAIKQALDPQNIFNPGKVLP